MGFSSPRPSSTASHDDDDDGRRQDAMWERRTHARILVSDADAGCIIGKAGYDIHAMEARSGAHIKLSGRGRPLPGTDRRVVLVSGLFRTVMDAAELVLEKLFYLGDQVIDAEATVVLVVPDACCGALIGKGGEVIKSLAEESNAGITVSPYDICYGFHDRLVTITGHLDNQLQAIFLILSELLDDVRYSSSVASLSFPSSSVRYGGDGQDEHVERYHSRPDTPVRSPDYDSHVQGTLTMGVADEYVGAVIGYGGRTIQEIERVTGVQIKIVKGEFIPGTNEREVVISGTREAVDAAEAMIMQRVSDAAKGRRRQQGGGGGDRRPVKEVE
ncbi:protein BTR1 isoform X2 [Aegilops tauschii subsp. strangulata]|nr:protein BTR1 isoform X2 [Aegilops tauschii subsp. strangulata]